MNNDEDNNDINIEGINKARKHEKHIMQYNRMGKVSPLTQVPAGEETACKEASVGITNTTANFALAADVEREGDQNKNEETSEATSFKLNQLKNWEREIKNRIGEFTKDVESKSEGDDCLSKFACFRECNYLLCNAMFPAKQSRPSPSKLPQLIKWENEINRRIKDERSQKGDKSDDRIETDMLSELKSVPCFVPLQCALKHILNTCNKHGTKTTCEPRTITRKQKAKLLFMRLLMILHNILTIWRVTIEKNNPMYWILTLTVIFQMFEGGYSLFKDMRIRKRYV